MSDPAQVKELESHALPIEAGTDTLSASSGGVVNFTLEGGVANAGRPYALPASASGSVPGLVLPGGGGVLPVNQDFVFNFVRSHFGRPMFPGFQGNLDATGAAAAALDTQGPVPPALPAGSTLHFAWTTLSPYDFQSNSVVVEIVP